MSGSPATLLDGINTAVADPTIRKRSGRPGEETSVRAAYASDDISDGRRRPVPGR